MGGREVPITDGRCDMCGKDTAVCDFMGDVLCPECVAASKAAPETHPLHTVTGTFHMCAGCLDGLGGECHTPGCLLYFNRAPDVPIRGTLTLYGVEVRLAPWARKEIGDE